MHVSLVAPGRADAFLVPLLSAVQRPTSVAMLGIVEWMNLLEISNRV
jgi:hypothetical protein